MREKKGCNDLKLQFWLQVFFILKLDCVFCMGPGQQYVGVG